jgi:hypothetical protein
VTKGIELQIQPYEADGLSFKRSDEESVRKIKFDGNDHPDLERSGASRDPAYSGAAARIGLVLRSHTN